MTDAAEQATTIGDEKLRLVPVTLAVANEHCGAWHQAMADWLPRDLGLRDWHPQQIEALAALRAALALPREETQP